MSERVPSSRRSAADRDEVVFATRLHWLRLARALAAPTLVIACVLSVFFWWRSAPTWFGAVLGALFTASLFLAFVRAATHRAATYLVTREHLVIRTGLVRRTTQQIALTSIAEVSAHQSFLGRLARRGEVAVTVPGHASAVMLRDVRRPRALVDEIAAARDGAIMLRARTRAERARAEERAEEAASLDELHARGIITDAEWRARSGRDAPGGGE